ncbi:hypothetical protein FB45DRAFT_871380 [Roridomyces roridus]|uniref:Uncharacterized protein n=1 Tax=Roridomyces roridus TaxID=1738132 RepID=A0AAD7BH64_9AGAR|nr:hypothetical protein FB45DRAFT_871380 [Roridomyces roridus]
MKLSLTATFIALAALALPVTAQVTEPEIVKDINAAANLSSNANAALQPLSTATAGAQVVVFEVNLVNDFTGIINAVNATIPALQATPPFPSVAQNVHALRQETPGAEVVAALDNVGNPGHIELAAAQAFLATVIGKHSIFAQFAIELTAPIAAVLRSLEIVVDAVADALIALIPTQATVPGLSSRAADTISSDKAALDTAIGNTVNTYIEECQDKRLYVVTLWPSG